MLLKIGYILRYLYVWMVEIVSDLDNCSFFACSIAYIVFGYMFLFCLFYSLYSFWMYVPFILFFFSSVLSCLFAF